MMGILFAYQHNLTMQFCSYISHAPPSGYLGNHLIIYQYGEFSWFPFL
jgi:hypothetical protein